MASPFGERPPHMEEYWVKCLSTESCCRECEISGGYRCEQVKTERREPLATLQWPTPACTESQSAISVQYKECCMSGAPTPPTSAHFLHCYRHGWNGHFKFAQPRLQFPEPMSKKHTHYPLYYPKQLFCPTREWTTWEGES